MGTRSNTKIIDVEHSYEPHDTEWDQPVELVNLYRQFDGYPDGHGIELFEFLDSVDHNGVGCLAAQMVAHFKKGPRHFYLDAVGVEDDNHNDYTYSVFVSSRGVDLKVDRFKEQVFSGSLIQFGHWVKEHG